MVGLSDELLFDHFALFLCPLLFKHLHETQELLAPFESLFLRSCLLSGWNPDAARRVAPRGVTVGDVPGEVPNTIWIYGRTRKKLCVVEVAAPEVQNVPVKVLGVEVGPAFHHPVVFLPQSVPSVNAVGILENLLAGLHEGLDFIIHHRSHS